MPCWVSPNRLSPRMGKRFGPKRTMHLLINNLGDHYAFKQQDLESGTACFEAALKYDPDFVMALHNLGTVELAQGRTSDAQRRFERALGIDPRFVPALGNLALIHLDQGNVEEAEVIVRRILKISPEDPRARGLAGKIEAEKAANRQVGMSGVGSSLGEFRVTLYRLSHEQVGTRRSFPLQGLKK